MNLDSSEKHWLQDPLDYHWNMKQESPEGQQIPLVLQLYSGY